MGPPVVCDVDLGDILGPRMVALAEGCPSEDEVELEGDEGQLGYEWSDVEEELVAGPSKVCVEALTRLPL